MGFDVGILQRFKREEQENAWRGSVDIERLLRYERRGCVDMLVKQSIVGTIVPCEATEEMLQGNTDVQRMLRSERRGHLLDVLVKKSIIGIIVYATYYPGDRKIKICLAVASGTLVFVGLFSATQKMSTRDIKRMCSMTVYKKLNRSRLNDISLVGSNSNEPFDPRGDDQFALVTDFKKMLKAAVRTADKPVPWVTVFPEDPQERGGANLHILKPKAKQTSRPSPAAPAAPAAPEPSGLLSIGGSSFPALENTAPAEAKASRDLERAEAPGAGKDEEANPSEFAHLRKSAIKKPGGSSAAALSPNKVQFDPQTHAIEMAGAMKEILRLVLRSDTRALKKRPAACVEGADAIPASGSKPQMTPEAVSVAGTKPKATAAPAAKAKADEEASAKGKAKAGSKVSASAPKGKSTAKPKAKMAVPEQASDAESSVSTKKPRPPPMEQGQGTVYYMQGKVHRNSGCFRVFKRASDKIDLKIKIRPDAPIAELWDRALDIIEAAAAEPWDVS
eukprot:symbB.v1.2.032472.t1/scaffold3898.1/size48671/4